VFGAWIAYTLRRAGHTVTLFDPYGTAHSRASSGGESRIIRCCYGADEIYTRMAQRSLTLSSLLPSARSSFSALVFFGSLNRTTGMPTPAASPFATRR